MIPAHVALPLEQIERALKSGAVTLWSEFGPINIAPHRMTNLLKGPRTDSKSEAAPGDITMRERSSLLADPWGWA